MRRSGMARGGADIIVSSATRSCAAWQRIKLYAAYRKSNSRAAAKSTSRCWHQRSVSTARISSRIAASSRLRIIT